MAYIYNENLKYLLEDQNTEIGWTSRYQSVFTTGTQHSLSLSVLACIEFSIWDSDIVQLHKKVSLNPILHTSLENGGDIS